MTEHLKFLNSEFSLLTQPVRLIFSGIDSAYYYTFISSVVCLSSVTLVHVA